MRVAITGSHGFVGRHLCARLDDAGWSVRALVRGEPAGPAEARWAPADPEADVPAGDCDAVIHLAGENLAAGRWTRARMDLLRRSRVDATRHLCEALARREPRPRVLLCASAVGFYGDRGEAELDETSAPGRGFLPGLCRDWEAATAPARAAGLRVVCLRLGAVLGTGGGMLRRLLPAYRLGLGGPLGSGRQYVPWVALEDVCAVVPFLLAHPSMEGPVNVVAPDARPQREFARALGRALRRPAALPAPAPLLRALLGPMAGEVLLSGARVRPARLLDAGFRFRFPDLDGFLAHALGAP